MVSEDGGVDIIPDRPPTLRRSAIDDAIGELADIAKADVINARRYNSLVKWLESKKFYLREEDCAGINRLLFLIDERIAKANPDGFHIIRNNLVANPDFDPELFYE